MAEVCKPSSLDSIKNPPSISNASDGLSLLKQKIFPQQQCENLKNKILLPALESTSSVPKEIKNLKTQKKQKIEIFDIEEALLEEKDIPKTLKMVFAWLFQDGEDVKGVGFRLPENFKKNIESLPLAQKIKNFQEIESQNKKTNRSWQEKIRYSLSQAEYETVLLREGYQKQKGEISEKKVKNSSLVRELLSPQKITDIESGKIQGALDLDAEISAGSFLCLQGGYPISVSPQSGIPASHSIFVQMTAEAKAEISEKSEKEQKIAMLENNLEVGDILTLNENSSRKKGIKSSVLKLARLAQHQEDDSAGAEDFHSIHTVVYLGNGKVAQFRRTMTGDLQNPVLSLSSLFKNYSGVSVSRMNLDAQTRNDFAKNAENISKGATSYNNERAIETAKNAFLDSTTGLPTSRSSIICTDVLRLAADDLLKKNTEISDSEKSELEKLRESNMAMNIFDQFYNPYSLNMGE